MPVFYHDLILEGLNQIVSSTQHKSGKMKYNAENFSEVSWYGVPMIFSESRTHLNRQKYLEDPATELKRNNAYQIGYVQDTFVKTEPSPQLDAYATIINEYAESLIQAGELRFSTDFDCPFRTSEWEGAEIGELVGKVKPLYVHCWKTEGVQNEQNDIVARFMNATPIPDTKTEEIKMDQDIAGRFDKIEAAIGGLLSVFGLWKTNEDTRHMNATPAPEAPAITQVVAPPVVTQTPAPVTQAPPESPAENPELKTLQEEKAKLEAEVTKMQEEAKVRLESEATAKQAALEASWNTVKTRFQPAVMHEEGSEAAMKTLYLESPHEFIMKYGDLMNLNEAAFAQHQNSTRAAQHQNSTPPSDEVPCIGSFDALTGGWK
jgi:hypothetical protein